MELNRENIKKILGIIGAAILLYAALQEPERVTRLLSSIITVLAPFIIGVSIAFILNVPMRFIERHLFYKGSQQIGLEQQKGWKRKVARPVSLLLTIVFVLGIILVVIFMIAPEIGKTFWTMIDGIQRFMAGEGAVWFEKLSERFPQIEQNIEKLNIDWKMVGNTIVTFIKDGFGGVLDSAFFVLGSIVDRVINFFLGFVFGIYILLSKEALSRQGKKLLYAWFSEKRADRIVSVVRLVNHTFSNFLSGQCLDALIIAFLFFCSMTLFRFPYALLLSVLIGFTALIPVFGSFIGCVISIFMILMVNPVQAFWFLVMFLIIQQLEETFIYPNVVGNSVGLPAIWALGAVVLGGSLMGIVGMLLFIPVTSVSYSLLREQVERKLSKRGIDSEKWDKEDIFLYPAEEATEKRRFQRLKQRKENRKKKR